MEKKAGKKNKVRRFYFVKINPLLDLIHQHEADHAPISDQINLNMARQRETCKRLERLRGEQRRIEYSSSRKNIEQVETLYSGSSAAKLIHKLQYGRGCRDLATERKILREMKGLEERNDNARTNAPKKRQQIRDSLKSPKAIHEQIKHINGMRDAVEKEWAAISDAQNQLYNKSREMNGKLKEVKRCIYHIEARLIDVSGSHYDHLRLMLRAREFAKEKDVTALEQLSFTQMEEFMCHWNSSKSLRKLYERSKPSEQVMSPSSWLLNLKQLHCPSTPSPSRFSPPSLPPQPPPDVDVYKVNVAVAWHPHLKSTATGIVCRDSEGLVTFVVSLSPFSYPKHYGVTLQKTVQQEEASAIYLGIREAKRRALRSVHLELELDSQTLVDMFNHYHISPFHYYSDPIIQQALRLATSFTYFSISFVHKSSISTARFLAQRVLSWPCISSFQMYTVWGSTGYPLWLSQAFSFD